MFNVEKIQASVGMRDNGTKSCFNLPDDVATIVKLLNLTDEIKGGSRDYFRRALQLPASAIDLYRSILDYQRQQNKKKCFPPLAEDGHVDPNGMTLSRLSWQAHACNVELVNFSF